MGHHHVHDDDHAIDRARPPLRTAAGRHGDDAGPDGPAGLLGLQRAAGNRSVVRMLESQGLLNQHGDEHEAHADAVAAGTASGTGPALRGGVDDADRDALEAELSGLGTGTILPDPVRAGMEHRLGTDFGDVRVHTGEAAGRANAAIGSDAFTYGSDIYYASGRGPGADLVTAHELGHVSQQRAAERSGGGRRVKQIQRIGAGTFPVTNGFFELDMQTRQGKSGPPGDHIGLDGYIRFLPKVGAPNSNVIVFTQIAKLTDLAGKDIDAATDAAGGQAPRGKLGDPGIRTQDDALRGVVGGFSTDATHASGGVPVAPGTPLSPDYDVSAAAPGTTGAVGKTKQPDSRGGGTGGDFRLDPGFKRSDEDTDMDSTTLYDVPGSKNKTANRKFEFESVVRGVDTQITYGVVKWGFDIVDGVVKNDFLTVQDVASATFDEAMQRHMDFYTHEDMTFYFDFDSAAIKPDEQSKITRLLPYLKRNPKAVMAITGEADIRGKADYNRDLALRRAEAVRSAMSASGVPESQLDPVTIGLGAGTRATTNAGTGDMGGDPAVGADQGREANRWANRRVIVTFTNPKGP